MDQAERYPPSPVLKNLERKNQKWPSNPPTYVKQPDLTNGLGFHQGHRKGLPSLASLKFDHRDYQPLDMTKLNKNSRTPTEKANILPLGGVFAAGTPPSIGYQRYFKTTQISSKKHLTDERVYRPYKFKDYISDNYSKHIDYFPHTENSTNIGITLEVPVVNGLDKPKSPTSHHRTLLPSDYFSSEYGNPTLKYFRHGKEDGKKNSGNISPKTITLNTCSTFETLRCKGPYSPVRSKKYGISINDFALLKELGSGRYGTVYMVRHKATGFLAALKIIKRQAIIENYLTNQLTRELKIQAFLNHPNLIDLYGCFHDRSNIYILMELASDGQLYQKMLGKVKYSEEAAAFIIKNLLYAVRYMHSKRLLHRDIKPENIVLVHGIVKLCDFGWAVHCSKDNLRTTFCGTPLYLSPELLLGLGYDEKTDLWSVGILTYELVTGRTPFDIQNKSYLDKIVTDSIEFPTDITVSAYFKDFVQSLLWRNPKNRLDSAYLLMHPFITRYQELETCEYLCSH